MIIYLAHQHINVSFALVIALPDYHHHPPLFGLVCVIKRTGNMIYLILIGRATRSHCRVMVWPRAVALARYYNGH